MLSLQGKSEPAEAQVLKQLGFLVWKAQHIITGIHQECKTIYDRSQQLLARLDKLQTTVDSLKPRVAVNNRGSFSRPLDCANRKLTDIYNDKVIIPCHNLFISSTRPIALQEAYLHASSSSASSSDLQAAHLLLPNSPPQSIKHSQSSQTNHSSCGDSGVQSDDACSSRTADENDVTKQHRAQLQCNNGSQTSTAEEPLYENYVRVDVSGQPLQNLIASRKPLPVPPPIISTSNSLSSSTQSEHHTKKTSKRPPPLPPIQPKSGYKFPSIRYLPSPGWQPQPVRFRPLPPLPKPTNNQTETDDNNRPNRSNQKTVSIDNCSKAAVIEEERSITSTSSSSSNLSPPPDPPAKDKFYPAAQHSKFSDAIKSKNHQEVTASNGKSSNGHSLKRFIQRSMSLRVPSTTGKNSANPSNQGVAPRNSVLFSSANYNRKSAHCLQRFSQSKAPAIDRSKKCNQGKRSNFLNLNNKKQPAASSTPDYENFPYNLLGKASAVGDKNNNHKSNHLSSYRQGFKIEYPVDDETFQAQQQRKLVVTIKPPISARRREPPPPPDPEAVDRWLLAKFEQEQLLQQQHQQQNCTTAVPGNRYANFACTATLPRRSEVTFKPKM